MSWVDWGVRRSRGVRILFRIPEIGKREYGNDQSHVVQCEPSTVIRGHGCSRAHDGRSTRGVDFSFDQRVEPPSDGTGRDRWLDDGGRREHRSERPPGANEEGSDGSTSDRKGAGEGSAAEQSASAGDRASEASAGSGIHDSRWLASETRRTSSELCSHVVFARSLRSLAETPPGFSERRGVSSLRSRGRRPIRFRPTVVSRACRRLS